MRAYTAQIETKMNRKLKMLVVLGDGGHTAEIVRLVELLGPQHDYEYLITSADLISESKITVAGPVHYTVRPRAKDEKTWRVVVNLVRSFGQVTRLVSKLRPNLVLGSGPAVLVPVAIVGKLAGAKIIYVENACRVTDLSLTGKLMLKVADLFFVQWESLRERYPRTVFAGRLL